MLRLALVVLLSTAAHAQSDDHPVPTTGDRLILAGGAVAGLLPVAFIGPFAVVTVGATTYLTSAALDLHPTVGGVALDVAAGTGIAIVVGTAAGAVLYQQTGVSDLGTAVFSAVVGGVVGAAATGLVHGARLGWLRSRGLEVAPAALSVPGGDLEAGLRLSVRL